MGSCSQLHNASEALRQKCASLSLFEAEPGEFRLMQPIWDLRKGYESYLVSPLFPVVFSMLFYISNVMPFTLLDLYGSHLKFYKKYKIQPEKDVTWPDVRRAILLTVWNHLLYLLPISLAQWVWTPPTYLPLVAPTVWELVWQCYVALAIFDFEYYVWHFVHHKIRFLYRHVHALHHEYHSPHSWVTQYLHPWELISVGAFTTTSPWWFDSHPMTQWAFMQFSILVSVEAHIGMDYPIMPHHWMPFWGGGIKHDMHHQKPLTNFQPFFNWFDRWFETECPGQLAGGYKPKALTDWEKKNRDAMLRRLGKLSPDNKPLNGNVPNINPGEQELSDEDECQ